jgi:hypothetical protein
MEARDALLQTLAILDYFLLLYWFAAALLLLY